MGERGVPVDHSTIYRWVQKYAPEIEKRLRWHWRRPQSTSWRVDETYVKVRGKWTYLYRAVDKFCNTIDFYLSPTRNAKAAKRFLGKPLNGLKDWETPPVINTDKAQTYGIAIAQLKAEGKCPGELVHRQVKYLNNIVEGRCHVVRLIPDKAFADELTQLRRSRLSTALLRGGDECGWRGLSVSGAAGRKDF